MKTTWRGVLFCIVFLASVSNFANPASAQNDFLITSFSGSSIERFDAESGANLGTFISANSGGLTNAAGVAEGPDSNVYVTSWGSNEILRYDGMTGEFIDVFASGDGLFRPNNIVLRDDTFFVSQTGTGSSGFVRRYDAHTGEWIDNFFEVDAGDGILFTNDSAYVSAFSGGVNRYDLIDGSLIEEFISAGAGGLANPTALLQMDDGTFLVSSFGTNSIKHYDVDGNFLGDAITGIFQPEGLAIGPNGSLYAGSFGSGFVNEYDATNFEFIGEFANVGGNTNFFTFRTSAIPEPSSTLIVLFLLAAASRLRTRRTQPTCNAFS